MSDKFDDFQKEVAEANKESSKRSEYFKLSEGDNKILVLSNPKRFGEVFGIGLAYEDCGYGKYASNKFLCYVKDLKDNTIKLAKLSYTTAGQLVALGQGARTKFDGFPMPYVVNIKTKNAGSKEIETNILAEEDYSLSEDDEKVLSELDTVEVILTRMKDSQKKKVDSDVSLQDKIRAFIEKKEQEYKERGEKMKKEQEIPTVQVGEKVETDNVEYPEEEINLEDIPF